MTGVDRRDFMKAALVSMGAGAMASWPDEASAAQERKGDAVGHGRLYYSDTGRVLLEHNEEVSRWRRVRKQFTVPVPHPRGELWLFVGENEKNSVPLVVDVNGKKTRLASSGSGRGLHWERVEVPGGALRRGPNEVILSTPSDLTGTWFLGAEMVSTARASALSLDGGRTWHSRGMGVQGLTPAEYVIRLWVDNAPAAPNATYALIREQPGHPQLKALARHFKLSDAIQGKTHTFDKVRALSTQVAMLWKVGQAPPGYGYNCPWDAFTIVGWMNAGKVQNRMRPVAYCVHFSICMVQFCAAVGITARSVVMEDDHPKCPTGHFTSEVWVPEWKRWIYVDPNLDAVYEADGKILSMADLSDACLAKWWDKVKRLDGPGYGNDPRIARGTFAKFEQYEGFRRWGVYPRTDFCSSPGVHPVQHGSSEYHQTQFIWYADPRLARRRHHPNYTDDLKALYAEPTNDK